MGTDILAYAERQADDGSWELCRNVFPEDLEEAIRILGRRFPLDDADIFPHRDYDLFTFLADVRRSQEHLPTIAQPRGLPSDVSPELSEDRGEYGASWLLVDELLKYDYDQRFGYEQDDSSLESVTLREILGADYFRRLARLEALGDPTRVRVVFWFG